MSTPTEYRRVPIEGEAVVVAFDICSSSNIYEELMQRGDLERVDNLLTSIKHFLAAAQQRLIFDPYKFIGDGWILLFPEDTNGRELLAFLKELSVFFRDELEKQILRYLATRPPITGLTFGIDKGSLAPMTTLGQQEYWGWAINVACRLQIAVKEGIREHAYKALVSEPAFKKYFAPAKDFKINQVPRHLRNIRGGSRFQCIEIEVLSPTAHA